MSTVKTGLLSLFLLAALNAFSQNAVGIGDVNFTPNYLLHLHQTVSTGGILQLTNSSTGSTTSDGLIVNLNGNNVEFNNVENADIRFFTNNTEKVRMDAAGNVGIGITPVQKLHVAGNVQFSGALMPGALAGTTGQILVSQGAGIAPTWNNANSVVQIVSDLQGAVNTAYNNNTVTYTNSLISNSFTLTAPGYYVFQVFVGHPNATTAIGMNFRLQNMTSATTTDGPYFCQFPGPGIGDYGGPANISLFYNKTTSTSETMQVQWAASIAGGTTGCTAFAGSRSARITVYRYPL